MNDNTVIGELEDHEHQEKGNIRLMPVPNETGQNYRRQPCRLHVYVHCIFVFIFELISG